MKAAEKEFWEAEMVTFSGGIGRKKPCPECNPEGKSELEMAAKVHLRPCRRCGGTGFISSPDGWRDDDKVKG